MKTAIFTLAALFGLGLGLMVVGVQFGRVILGSLVASLALVTLVWTGTKTLHGWVATPRRAPTSHITQTALATAARHLAPLARLTARLPRLPFTPLLSVLMGLSLGAALARDAADLPAALLCGALAGALHLLAFAPPADTTATPPPARITPETDAQLSRLIAALAPCRDPHLHRAARALRRTAATLAEQADSRAEQPDTAAALPQARRALALWLPALADAVEHLRERNLSQSDPNELRAQSAALTDTLTRVTAQLASLAPQPAAEPAPDAPSYGTPLATAHPAR